VLDNKLVSLLDLRHILSGDVEQDDGTIILDKDCDEVIVFNCFYGVNQEI
jgi:hypothetical protein